MSAETYIREALLAVLPPGVPPAFTHIVNARFEGSGRNRKAVAGLTFFDGLSAIVMVRNAGPCTSHGFPVWEGGDLSFERGKWLRIPREVA